jgi:prepilin-type N-terminal cleavage/methylation domain-containing protein
MKMSLARPSPDLHRARRTGYTLLELMLVLAVLTVMVAMAWPSLRKPLHRSVVQQAAGQLVKDLGQARLAAIESGQVIRFRYEPDGARYVLDAASAEGNAGEGDRDDSPGDDFSDETAGDGEPSISTDNELSSNEYRVGGGGGQPDERPAWSLRGELPDEVIFRDPAVLSDAELPPGSALGDMLSDEAAEREEVKPLIDREGDESELSVPVFFYPDGRAENAEMVLVGPEEYRMTVRVRGLTGAASLGPLEHPVREVSDRERQNREDGDREDPNRESPRNGGSNRGSSEREPSAAPRTERSTPAARPSVTRERD